MPGTVLHVFTNAIADGTNTQIVRPSDWNSAHAFSLSINATEISGLFSNQNGVSFGLDGTNITASIAAGGAPGSISAGTTRVALGEAVFSNSNGISFGLNGATVTASYTVPAVAGLLSAVNVSAGTTSNNLSALTFQNSNGVSFGLNGSVVTATVATNYLTSQSNQAVSGQNGSSTFQTLSFANANGISFGTDAAGFTASHNALTSQSNQAASASNGSFTFQTLNFSNANNVTFGTSAGGIVTASVGAGGGDAIRGIAANGSTASTNTVHFSDANGVSFGFGAAGNSTVMTASHNGLTTQTNQQVTAFATGNTTQSSSGTYNASSMIFRGSGVASVGVSNGSVIVDVPAGGGGITNINVSAGTTSNNLSNLVFSNANGMEFGLNGSTVTANASVWISNWPLMFATGAQSKNSGTSGGTGASTQYTVSVNLHPIIIEHNLTFDDVAMVMSAQTVAGTGSATVGYAVGIYSLNASTALSLISSAQFVAVVSQNSLTARTASWWWGTNSTSNSSSLSGNVSASFTAARRMLMSTGANSLSRGQYWIGFCHTASTAGSNIHASASVAGLTMYQQPSVSNFGTNSNIGSHQLNGAASTTTNFNVTGLAIMPASINTSAITTQNAGSTAEHIVFRSRQ